MSLNINGIHTPTQHELEDIFRPEDETTFSSKNGDAAKRDPRIRKLPIRFKIGFLQNNKDKKMP